MYFGSSLFASFHQFCIIQLYTNFITRKIRQARNLHKSVLFQIFGKHWTERYCHIFFCLFIEVMKQFSFCGAIKIPHDRTRCI